MSFRTRLVILCAVLAGLLALLALGIFFSPESVQSRRASQALLPGLGAQKIDAVDIAVSGQPAIGLKKTAGGWETASGGEVYPASAERIATFLRIVLGLQRSSLVSSSARHLGDLGLSPDTARLLVLHQPGTADIGLLVGKRGPGGDADYVQVRGERAVYLARGSLAFFLAQEQSYWYELHVLPDDVQGDTIASISVKGSLRLGSGEALRGGYTLLRPAADRLDQWVLGGSGKKADRVTAGAMASSVAQLECIDFAGPSGSPPTPGMDAGLAISVTTFTGKTYSLSVGRGQQPGKALITTDWSPWTYIVSEVPLLRAVLPEPALAAAP